MKAEEIAARLGIPLRRMRDSSPIEAKGPVTVRLQFFRGDDPEQVLVGADGTRQPRGVSVKDLRARFGGNSGVVEDMFGNKHRISLPAKIAEEENMYVKIIFRFEEKNPPSHSGVQPVGWRILPPMD